MEALLGWRVFPHWLALALGVAGCGAAAPPEPTFSRAPGASRAEPAEGAAPDLERPEASPTEPEPGPAGPPSPEATNACRDELGEALARVSCDGTRILTAHPIELAPSHPRPSEPSRSELGAVAALLRRDPSILFVRIEVRATERVSDDSTRRREQTLAAQARADALFQYLWRKLGIDAERMEAVGYPYDPRKPRSEQRFAVTLRIVHRRRP